MAKRNRKNEQADNQPAIFQAMQGLCFWVAHRHSYYYKHPLPEGALVAEFANLLEGRLPANNHLYCEILYKNTLARPAQSKDFGTSRFQDCRADLLIATEAVSTKTIRTHDFSKSVEAVIEVKRGTASKATLSDDLSRLHYVKSLNPDISSYLLIASESTLPTQLPLFSKTARQSAAEATATNRKIFIEKIDSHVAVRRVCKAMASSKAKQVHSAVLVEVLGV